MKFNLNNTKHYAFLALQLNTKLCLVNLSAQRKTHDWEDQKVKENELSDLWKEVFSAERDLLEFQAQCGGTIADEDQPDYLIPKINENGTAD